MKKFMALKTNYILLSIQNYYDFQYENNPYSKFKIYKWKNVTHIFYRSYNIHNKINDIHLKYNIILKKYHNYLIRKVQ